MLFAAVLSLVLLIGDFLLHAPGDLSDLPQAGAGFAGLCK
jgi:hypothetical protein